MVKWYQTQNRHHVTRHMQVNTSKEKVRNGNLKMYKMFLKMAAVSIKFNSCIVSALTSGTDNTCSCAYGRSTEIPSNLNRIRGTFASFTQWISDTSGLLLSMLHRTTKKSSCISHIHWKFRQLCHSKSRYNKQAKGTYCHRGKGRTNT